MAKHVKVGSVAANKPKNPAAVALGRLGGLKGGDARAAGMTAERRSEIAQRAAKQRWAKEKGIELETAVDRTAAPVEEARLA